jgi:trimeric autotransporter adhesin
VTFSPSQSGTRAGTLSIASSATPLPLTATLTGTGAQAQLQITPDGLAFGPVNIGSSASLSVTLLNTGTAPITGITLSITGDYTVTAPCATTTLAGGASCSVTLTFSPTATGIRSGILTVTSSDAGSPASIPLSGTGTANGSFTLTVNGASSASATVASGSPAGYSLIVTPTNGFAGAVVFNCTPVIAAQYATCSLLPSSVMLSGAAQSATATVNTVTSLASSADQPFVPGQGRGFGSTALALLFPTLVFVWKARTSRHRAWRQVGPAVWTVFAGVMLLTSGGCGGGGNNASANTSSSLRYAPAGNYQYQVTASGTSGNSQITQTVTLNLTVQ